MWSRFPFSPPTHPSFEIRSRLFCEYRLCCTLNGLAPPSATLHLTNSRSVSSEQSHLNCSVSRTNASGNDVMTRSFTSKSVGVASSVGGRGQRDSVLCSTVSEEVESINNNWEEELITKETQRDDKSPHYGMCDPSTLLMLLIAWWNKRCVVPGHLISLVHWLL